VRERERERERQRERERHREREREREKQNIHLRRGSFDSGEGVSTDIVGNILTAISRPVGLARLLS
jgi:hypothetical protein